MKKITAIVLTAVLVLSLCACGSKIDETAQKKMDLYDKYENYIDLLEEGNYENLINKLMEKYGDQLQSEPDQPGEPEDPGQTDSPNPTEEERYQLQQYFEIVDSLYWYEQGSGLNVTEYDENGVFVRSHREQSALRFCMQKLQELTIADSWTEWLQEYYNYGCDYNWDRLELLGRFSMVEDVMLVQKWTRVDNLGNYSASTAYWTYWEDGRTAYRNDRTDDAFALIKSEDPMGRCSDKTCYYTYDDNGCVTEIRVGSADHTYYLVTLSYDADGNKVNEHFKSSSDEWDITYAYDAQNRLIQVEHPSYAGSSAVITITYTYDASGNMVQEEVICSYYSETYQTEMTSYKYITDYTYDASGDLESGVCTYQNWSYTSSSECIDGEWVDTVTQYVYRQTQDLYDFTCDEQGRPLTLVVTHGDEYCMTGDNAGQVSSPSSYVSTTYEFTYGDYLFYGE